MILVTGGTGFVGPNVVHALRARSATSAPRPQSRPRRDAQGMGLRAVPGRRHRRGEPARAVAGCDTVVHLVAIIAGSREDFDRVMTGGTRNSFAAAKAAGVRRFVLMSALGVSEHTRALEPYYQAKWAKEEAVGDSGIEHVVFRPSFVFGSDGGALPLFVRHVRWSPVTPVPGSGKRQLQPIWVEDVAAYFAAAIDPPGAANRTFDLVGPDRVTWNELYERIARTLGKRRRRAHVPICSRARAPRSSSTCPARCSPATS